MPAHTCLSGVCGCTVHEGGYLYLSMHVKPVLRACRGVSSKSSLCWIPLRLVFTSWQLWSTVAAYTWWVTLCVMLEEKSPQIQDFLNNSLLSSPSPRRTTFRHWLGCVMTGWRVSSTWFSSPLSLLWCSPPLCAVCHIPGLARGNTHSVSLRNTHKTCRSL